MATRDELSRRGRPRRPRRRRAPHRRRGPQLGRLPSRPGRPDSGVARCVLTGAAAAVAGLRRRAGGRARPAGRASAPSRRTGRARTPGASPSPPAWRSRRPSDARRQPDPRRRAPRRRWRRRPLRRWRVRPARLRWPCSSSLVGAVHRCRKTSVSDKRAELAARRGAGCGERGARRGSLAAFTRLRAAARHARADDRALDRRQPLRLVARDARGRPRHPGRRLAHRADRHGRPRRRAAAAAAAASALRGDLPLPAIEIIGCTTGQDAVAPMLTALRHIDGVAPRRAAAVGQARRAPRRRGAAGSDCRRGSSDKAPQLRRSSSSSTHAVGAVPTGGRHRRTRPRGGDPRDRP